MKICIYQIAFIAAVLSVSNMLYCKHNDHSSKSIHDVIDGVKKLEAATNEMIPHAQTATNLHKKAFEKDAKDKSVSGTRRSRIKRAQSLSSTGSAQKDREIKKNLDYINKTLEQIQSSTRFMKNSNDLTQQALNDIPAE